jgi:hypothetical protein
MRARFCWIVAGVLLLFPAVLRAQDDARRPIESSRHNPDAVAMVAGITDYQRKDPLTIKDVANTAEIPKATVWNGTYYYSQETNAPVPFSLELQIDGTSVRGRTSEPATFGNGKSPYLYATIFGTISGTPPRLTISFRKTYDGTGGVTHSVEYWGAISADWSSMSGYWQVGTNNGSFKATRK